MNLLISSCGGVLVVVELESRVVLEAALVLVLAHVPPFLRLCLKAAVGRLSADIAPAAVWW